MRKKARTRLSLEMDRNTVVYGPYYHNKMGAYVCVAHHGEHGVSRHTMTLRRFAVRSKGREFQWHTPPDDQTTRKIEEIQRHE